MKESTIANDTDRSSEKKVYLEICRIIAIFCIMYQHTGGRGADAWQYTGSSLVYAISMTGMIISCIGVPLFWMISGALLLSRQESWKKVYGRRMPRIAAVLVIFSIIRYVYQCLTNGQAGSVGAFLKQFGTKEIFLPYWFLYEYLGILLILPFLKKIVQNLTQQEKQLLFGLILGWNVLNDIFKIGMGTGFMIGFSFPSSIYYFMLGYLLENCGVLRKNDRKGLWCHIGCALFVTVCLFVWMHAEHGIGPLVYAAEGSLGMFLTTAVYYVVRYLDEKSRKSNMVLQRFVLWCGKNVFGLYLIEDYLRNGLTVIWEFLGPRINTIPACAVWLTAVFLTGNVLIAGARRLPLFRKIL